ncbi:MAG: NAD(P)H-dependent glycerol-3-phosphate dehydrogenase [Spirochaetota bacterium]
MLKAAVLGAGFMGSAITFPLMARSIKTRLWGTWLDDELIDGALKGCHPRLKKPLPEGLELYRSEELEYAVRGVDAVFIAIASEGFEAVFKRYLKVADGKPCLFALTKGFVHTQGKVYRISSIAEKMYRERFGDLPFLWASIGGPVKAVELTDRIPTATTFGVNNNLVNRIALSFATDYYRIFFTDDVIGVEICSALKNVYSIAIGISDGMYEGSGVYYHNLRALLFSQALMEMALVVSAAGGWVETVLGLPGSGDLHLTSSSGRNGLYGMRIGRGEKPEQAYREMLIEGNIAEGYNTLRMGIAFVKQLGKHKGYDLMEKLPLFQMLYRIIFQGCNFKDEMDGFVKNYGAKD